MDAKSMVIRHWEDVVFENRNKDYGAYLLRRAYARRLLMGLGITVTLVSVMLSMHNLSPKREIRGAGAPPLTGSTIDLSQPPTLKPRTPQNTTTRPQRTTSSAQIVVTTDVVEETQIQQVADFVSGEESDEGSFGMIEGTGDVPLDVPVPVEVSKVVDFAEVMPQYDGGTEAMMKFIQKKIRFPRAPREQGIGGKVYVRFVVSGDGTVRDVEVIRGVHPDYDREAVRVISMLPAWKGGRQGGMPVSVRMVIPISFNVKM